MQELIDLQNICLHKIQNHVSCAQSCPIGNYCGNCHNPTCDCSACLFQIQHGNPAFHYSCYKITYHYTLRFFNRFASEITYLLCKFDYSSCKDLNVVSLGCGPGSEIYGILKTFMLKKAATKLHYEGHDMNPYWEDVQTISQTCLSKSGHDINFYTTNLFADYHGFSDNEVSVLIFNYLLSDAALFMSNIHKIQFVDEITDFILKNNVKNVLFNDINYYGYAKYLDSGTQMMKLIISKLKKHGCKLKEFYFCFPNDPCLGNEGWDCYQNNDIVLAKMPGNGYMANVGQCKSKQIIVQLI